MAFQIGLADPTGSYGITAVQGASRATGGFTAVLPAKPRIEALDPTSGAPGTVFRFAVVSPSPNQTLSVDLYRREGGTPFFATTAGTVLTDAQARASYQVPTRADTPAGQYCLVVRPFANACASFTLR